MHSYLLPVSSSKGSFGEESLEIGSLRCIVVIWEEGGGRKEGLSKVYGRGDNSGKPPKQDSASLFRDNGATDKGISDVLGGGSAIIGCFQVSKILHRITRESNN
jgi:hypothetical protein